MTSGIQWLDRVLIPFHATTFDRVVMIALYIAALSFALGGLWAFLSVMGEVLQPKIRVQLPARTWRIARFKTRLLADRIGDPREPKIARFERRGREGDARSGRQPEVCRLAARSFSAPAAKGFKR